MESPESPFQFGFLEALYRVIEERLPYGRAITTGVTVLVLTGIVVFVMNYLVGTLTPIVAALISHGVHLALYVRALVTNRPFPAPGVYVVETRAHRLITGLLLLALMGMTLVLIQILEKEAKERDTALEQRVVALENLLKKSETAEQKGDKPVGT